MPRRGIWCFVPIFLFPFGLTNAPANGQLVDLQEQDNSQRNFGNHLILIFAPGLRLKRPEVQPQLPNYNFTSRTEHNDLSSEEEIRSASKNDDAYYLYHVLRTTEENPNLDDRVLNTVKKTKSLLRPLLRSRCNQLQSCETQCPQKKKRKCVQKCKVKIDVYAVCEKPCRPPKCGRTLPPDW